MSIVRDNSGELQSHIDSLSRALANAENGSEREDGHFVDTICSIGHILGLRIKRQKRSNCSKHGWNDIKEWNDTGYGPYWNDIKERNGV